MSIIRQVRLDDAQVIADIYAPYCATPISFELVAPSAGEMADRIERLSATYPWLVYEDERQLCGYAYASPHHERQAYRWSVNVSVYIRDSARRRGIGRSLYQQLFSDLREQRFINAYAGITLPNESSVGLHEALGFHLVGVYEQVGFKCGQWHDVAWYGLRLQAPQAIPQEPKTPGPVAGV